MPLSPEQSDGLMVALWIAGLAAVAIVGYTWGTLDALVVVVAAGLLLGGWAWWSGRQV